MWAAYGGVPIIYVHIYIYMILKISEAHDTIAILDGIISLVLDEALTVGFIEGALEPIVIS